MFVVYRVLFVDFTLEREKGVEQRTCRQQHFPRCGPGDPKELKPNSPPQGWSDTKTTSQQQAFRSVIIELDKSVLSSDNFDNTRSAGVGQARCSSNVDVVVGGPAYSPEPWGGRWWRRDDSDHLPRRHHRLCGVASVVVIAVAVAVVVEDVAVGVAPPAPYVKDRASPWWYDALFRSHGWFVFLLSLRPCLFSHTATLLSPPCVDMPDWQAWFSRTYIHTAVTFTYNLQYSDVVAVCAKETE